MSRSVENIIREAMDRGEFDNLPLRGQPIDLTSYFATPEELRMAYSVLKNAGVMPAEAQYLADIAQLQTDLRDAKSEAEAIVIRRKIAQARLRYDLARGR